MIDTSIAQLTAGAAMLLIAFIVGFLDLVFSVLVRTSTLSSGYNRLGFACACLAWISSFIGTVLGAWVWRQWMCAVAHRHLPGGAALLRPPHLLLTSLAFLRCPVTF